MLDVMDAPVAQQPTTAVVRRVSPVNGQPTPEGWKPGQSGNPKGRPAIGASVLDWINAFGNYSLKEVRAVSADKAAPTAKIMAARQVLAACSERLNASGNRTAGPEIDRILDRTVGKAMQRAELLTLDAGSFDFALLPPEDLMQLVAIMDRARLAQTRVFPTVESIVTPHDK